MNRIEFCRWAKHQLQNNELFRNTVLFTDRMSSLLEEMPLFTRETMWYQHDGYPAVH
ncbi:hypothetical protein WN55_07961 [Dufourea novaeangliae]|uniref:Uncharacterized protein n=1 Tax=Dufourea novaeangliae TaxID=178035 RepID=A0A154P4H1_DUFNO|nr:hypothetical protein WN55_07961 [Dufourea novaeangliae]